MTLHSPSLGHPNGLSHTIEACVWPSKRIVSCASTSGLPLCSRSQATPYSYQGKHSVYSVNLLDESKHDSNQEVGQVKDIMRLAGYARGLDQDIPTHLLQSRIVRTEKIQKG